MRSNYGSNGFEGQWLPDRKLQYRKRPTESWQAMPLGTGQTGVVVWAESLLNLQFTRNDSWGPAADLRSLLRLRIEFRADRVREIDFTQTLDLSTGRISLLYTTEDGKIEIEVFAHRIEDVFEIIINDLRSEAVGITVIPEYWRSEVNPLVREGVLYFVEENRISAFEELNRNSGITSAEDNLKGNSYGSAISLEYGEVPDRLCPSYVSQKSRRHRIIVSCKTVRGESSELLNVLESSIKKALSHSTEEMTLRDEAFWKSFWEKSYIELAPDSSLQPVRATWYLNRFFAACSMHGKFAPKFNGSVFLYEYDRRYWGGAYWFQNTRLMYWPLFKSGDQELIVPFFEMYFKALDNVRERVRRVYGHTGAIFLETMHFWGAARAEDARNGEIVNDYIRSYFGGSLELIKMMITFYDYSGDSAFASRMLELAWEIIQFFFQHFPIANGKLYLSNSAALETWWDADNPADQIAGLRSLLPDLKRISQKLGYEEFAMAFEVALKSVPELPRGKFIYCKGQVRIEAEGKDFVPAERINHVSKENYEDPELYAVWPYGLLGKGLPEYGHALRTFNERIHKEPKYGWSQTAIWAARLGLAAEARKLVLDQFAFSANLPGGMMTSPGYCLGGLSEVTDCGYFDASGAIAIALQEMLLQEHTGRVLTLPAWPDEEPVAFKLLLPERVVEYEHRKP